MIGTIMVEGLTIECVIGILPEERGAPQTIVVDLELDRDFSSAAEREEVSHTADYVEIARFVEGLALEKRYRLLETFAEEAAAGLLDRFGGVRAMVVVRKPGAVPAARSAAVKVERRP